jgi:hypothetical protein
VFLRRRPEEPAHEGVQNYYATLLKAIRRPVFHEGEWKLCERRGWPDNPSFRNLLTWSWRKDSERYLVAANFSDQPLQARVFLPWPDVGDGLWQLTDEFSGVQYERQGDELARSGLYVELGPWGHHLFSSERQA